MVKRKNQTQESSSDTFVVKDVLYIPQLCIPYEIVKYGTANIVPKQIDEGLFRIRTPYQFSLDSGKTTVLKTNIRFDLPKFIDMSPCKGIRQGFETTVFPRAIVHGHLDSIYELMVENGLVVLGPRVVSADTINNRELTLFLQNIGKKMFTANAGDEIAELCFTITPVSTLKLFVG